MKRVRSLLGRRQFLIGAAAVSTLALAYERITKSGGKRGNPANAVAAERFETSHRNGEAKIYRHILSPIQIRNKIVKNRLFYPLAQPHYFQGPENYPADVLRAFYANNARAAGIVTPRLRTSGGSRENRILDSAHISIYDEENPAVQNYIDQMIEGIHAMGALVVAFDSPTGKTVQEMVDSAKRIEDKGYDVVYMDDGDTDAYLEQIQAVKYATNLIVIRTLRRMMGPGDPSSDATEATVSAARELEGVVDILRMGKGSATIYNAYTKKGSPDTLSTSQAIKEAGVKVLTLVGGGFGDPDIMESAIAGGKCDMVYLGRQLHADPDYARKIIEGRGDDVVPCLLCNRCHGNTWTGPWLTVCSVNPRFGLETAAKTLEGPTQPKTVAVIGGGPAGMKAAITAAERGHRVTLYEKGSTLGGLLQHADYTPYKWPHRDFKDYLIRQASKNGVAVQLNTEATPDMIRSKGYDAVLVATGAELVVPKIPGANSKNVFNIMTVHSNYKSLGDRVVFVGAGVHVVETAIWLVNEGHRVTVLTAGKELLRQDRVHYPDELQNITDTMDNFSFIPEVTTTRIANGKVFYNDAKGREISVPANSVVIYGGLKPRTAAAMSFSGSAKGAFLVIGDCNGQCGDLQKSIRSAYFAAYQI